MTEEEIMIRKAVNAFVRSRPYATEQQARDFADDELSEGEYIDQFMELWHKKMAAEAESRKVAALEKMNSCWKPERYR